MSTDRDASVLNAILNPSFPGIGVPLRPNRTVDEFPGVSSLPGFIECNKLEVEGVQLAEGGFFDEALLKFTGAINCCPSNPSPYNNRAQLYRLMQKIPEALADLDKSILLSNGKGYPTAQAYVQRAIIHRLGT